MTVSVQRIIHSMIHAELCDGSGHGLHNGEIVHLDTPDKLRSALLKAKDHIEFIPCSDVAYSHPK